MEEEIKVDVSKSNSTKVTNETKFGLTKGDLMTYNEDNSPRGFDTYPMITVTAAEDLEKFQYGIIRVSVTDQEGKDFSFLIQIDGLLGLVYSVYAKNLNDLRKPTIRQKTVRMYGWFRNMFDRIFT